MFNFFLFLINNVGRIKNPGGPDMPAGCSLGGAVLNDFRLGSFVVVHANNF
jgi:hypothetical protein